MELFYEYLARIEAVLDVVLPAAADNRWLSRVAGQPCQDAQVKQVDAFLEPGRALLKRGGKRWRPLVTILTCEALGGGRKADVLTALVEIPHNGSLIVDDIEDGGLTRRGGPAIHLEFGIDLAVNMGNLMYFLPTVVFDHTDFDVVTIANMTRDWLTVMRRLHLGQGYDILWHGGGRTFPDRDSYLLMCRFKTGSLSSLAARLGVRAAVDRLDSSADSRENLIERIGDAWEELGMGFQVLDDVQNLTSGVPGKDQGDDIVEGKMSLPVVLHLERCPEDGARLVELFARAAELVPRGDRTAIDEAVTLMEESGAIDAAREQGGELLDSGRQKLLSLLPESPARNLLMALADGFRERMV